jgi:alkylhydroperoxidase family enzyme
MNASRMWAYRPDLIEELFGLMGKSIAMHEISARRRGIIVAACASSFGDSYCSLAWGHKLADRAGAEIAAAVLTGSDEGLSADERALARWARRVASAPNATTADDVAELRDAGFTDAQIFAITVYVGLRIGFSTINDALGLRPDARLRADAPREVVAAVTFGRPIADPD